MTDHTQHFGQVQRRVADGNYQVNPTQVAEAILQRIGAITPDRTVDDPVRGGRDPEWRGPRRPV